MNKVKTLAKTLMGLAALAGTTAARANLIVNGSFETGDLTGWTSDSAYGLNAFGTTYGAGMDGTYWHWLAGYETPITTSQTVSGLTVGKTYTLKFIQSSEYVNSDQVRVTIGSDPSQIFTGVPSNPGDPAGNYYWNIWVEQQLSFVASATSEKIQFDTVGLNVSGYDVGVDNVRLDAAAPEVGTWIMMVAGFGTVGAQLRLRQRRIAAA